MVLGVATAFMGDLAGGEQQLLRAVDLAEDSGNPHYAARPHFALAEVLRLAGRTADALAVMRRGELVASRLGATVLYGHFCALNACEDLLRLGRWSEVDEHLAELSRLPLSVPHDEMFLCSIAGRLHTGRGDLDTATTYLERAQALLGDSEIATEWEYAAAIHASSAELRLWNGDVDAARAHISAGLSAVALVNDPLHVPQLYSMGARVEADRSERARALADTSEVERACQGAEELCGGLVAFLASFWGAAAPPETSAHLAGCRAESARAMGSPDPELWAKVASSWRELDAPYAVAYALFREAEALLSGSGGRADAQGALVEATRVCTALSAQPLREQILALGRRARLKVTTQPADGNGHAPASNNDSPAARLGLTNREAEVLGLLAAGMTNREISEQLYISKHTTSVHVSHILAKLGVPNRVMAASAAQRLGLATPA